MAQAVQISNTCSIHILDVEKAFDSLPDCSVGDLVVSYLGQTFSYNDER